jgi:hypothetical protein
MHLRLFPYLMDLTFCLEACSACQRSIFAYHPLIKTPSLTQASTEC